MSNVIWHPVNERVTILPTNHLEKDADMPWGKLIVWLIVGGLAGTTVGRLLTFKKQGFGRWTNLAVGLAGALLGGFLFNFFEIDLGLGQLKVTFEDLIAAIVGSLLLIFAGWGIRQVRNRPKKSGAPPAQV